MYNKYSDYGPRSRAGFRMTDIPGGGGLTRGGSGTPSSYPSEQPSHLQRLVPSGSPGGYGRVPNMRPLRGGPGSTLGRPGAWGALQSAKQLMTELTEFSLPSPWDLIDNPWATVGPSGWNVPAGWTKCPTPSCDGPPDFGVWGSNISCLAQAACPVGQAGGVWPTTRIPWGTVHATRLGVLAYEWTSGNFNDATFRGTIHAQFVRSSSAVTTMPTYSTGKALPLPAFLPGAQPKLGRRNKDNRAAAPAPRVTVDGRVADKPSVRPATEVVFSPGRVPPVIKGGEHVDEPDRKPTRKVRGVPGAMVAAIKLLHSLTELGDFVDALYEALPPIARCAGKRGLVHDLICVLEHADAFADPDVMAKAIGNLLWNHVEDKVIGALFGSNWRFGGSFRPDNYGGTAWVGGGYGAPQPDFGLGGLISWSGSARMSPM